VPPEIDESDARVWRAGFRGRSAAGLLRAQAGLIGERSLIAVLSRSPCTPHEGCDRVAVPMHINHHARLDPARLPRAGAGSDLHSSRPIRWLCKVDL
jgi:hypothetical protein